MSNSADLEARFSDHSLRGNQAERCKRIREQAKDLAYLILDLTSESREQSLAITKLEESVMWANTSIARK